jgi:hypothetical protein
VGFVVFSTVLLTGCAYLVMGLLLDDMSVGAVALSRDVVTGVALLVFVFFLVRRPQVAGNRIKAIFEMIADIAGFWPPIWFRWPVSHAGRTADTGASRS